MARWQNWSRETEHEAIRLYRPGSLQEMQDAVRDAAVDRGLQVRTVGAGHSWTSVGLGQGSGASPGSDNGSGSGDGPGSGTGSGAAAGSGAAGGDGGAVILTDRLDRILEVDRDEMTVTVEGGARLHDLGEALFDLGLSPPTLGDTDRQSLAGAVSTDTHGSGPKLRTLSEFVTGMTLVKADGSVHEVTEEEMPAARVSLGALGAIYSVQLRVIDALHLEHERTTVRFLDERDRLDERFHHNRHVEYWYFPYTEYADMILRRPTHPVPPRDYPLRTARMAAEAMTAEMVGRLLPEKLPLLLKTGAEGRLGDEDRRAGPVHKILPLVAQSTVDIIKTHTMEYLFPLESLWEAFDELRASIDAARDAGVFISLPIHVRFVRKSEGSLLSPCVHPITASLSINFSRAHDGFETWFRDFEQRMLDLGARSHLGKIRFEPVTIPDEFHEIRRQLDPDERFWNPGNVYGSGP